MNETLNVIARRYSCRSFTDKEVADEDLAAIANAAIAAPTGMNRQYYQAIVVTNKLLLADLETEGLRVMSEFPDKTLYERIVSRGGKLFYNAPCMIFLAVKEAYPKGAGRKRKGLVEKQLDGNPGHEPIKKLKQIQTANIEGNDMPAISDYLRKMTKNTNENIAPDVYEKTWQWLKERECEQFVKQELIEQYALYIARWIQCEEGINTYGLLAKHPTTGSPIASPYVSMGLNFLKQANVIWGQIFQSKVTKLLNAFTLCF